MDISNGLGLSHHLNEPKTISSREATIGKESERGEGEEESGRGRERKREEDEEDRREEDERMNG